VNRKEFEALPADIKADLERQMAKSLAPEPKLPYSLFLKEFKIKSLNPMLDMHWSVRMKYKNACYDALTLSGMTEVPKTFERRSVDFERIIPPGGKSMDEYENLPSGFKYILDGIVKMGWLHDDSPKWLEKGEVTQRKVKEGEDFGVNIKIKEVEK